MANKYRVEVCYRYRKQPGGVRLGMTIEAENEDEAIDQAKAKHIDKFPGRVHLMTTAELEPSHDLQGTDLVEEVAEAIYDNFFGAPGDTLKDALDGLVEFHWEEATPRAQAVMRRMARAAIATIDRLRRAAPEWQPISTYDTKSDPDCVLVCYEDGHVTPAEYLEHCDGGPDDHQTWSPIWPGKKTCAEYERDWPTHWRPLPPSSQAAAVAGEDAANPGNLTKESHS